MKDLIYKYKRFISAVADRFNALDRRRRGLILLLCIVVLASGLFNTAYKPQRLALRKMERELRSLKSENRTIAARIPDISRDRRYAEEEERSLSVLQAELEMLESQLPRQPSQPRLLGELVAQASGYSIDFISIQPMTEKKHRIYDRLDIEIRINAGDSEITNYLHRLENVSQYLRVNKVTAEKTEKGPAYRPDATILLSTLLGTDLEKGSFEEEKGVAGPEAIVLERDPFGSKEESFSEEEGPQEHDLTGIVVRGERSTAIIDGRIYRLGDVIGDKTVRQILTNAVMLGNDTESSFLTIHKKGKMKAKCTSI